jgi:TP53 regulating kinase-like protein
MKILAQGAEAVIKKGEINGENCVVKERIKKNYRRKELDLKLRKERTKGEARLLGEASRAGVLVPRVIEEDYKNYILYIEYIDGQKVRDWVDEQKDTEKLKELFSEVGKMTSKLHSHNIIHGDLTTSNMILKDKVYFIDFGLAAHTMKIEDKAVDAHLLKECLKSKHYEHWNACWLAFKDGYSKEAKELADDVFKRLKSVESRGRYKH